MPPTLDHVGPVANAVDDEDEPTALNADHGASLNVPNRRSQVKLKMPKLRFML